MSGFGCWVGTYPQLAAFLCVSRIAGAQYTWRMLYTFLYSYLVLVAGGWLAYRAVEPAAAVVILVATFLTLPVIIKDRGAQAISLTAALSAANALLFASLAYGIGR